MKLLNDRCNSRTTRSVLWQNPHQELLNNTSTSFFQADAIFSAFKNDVSYFDSQPSNPKTKGQKVLAVNKGMEFASWKS
jgi:hypothetical protein